MFGNPKRETCSERNLRASPYLYFAALYYFSRRTTIPNFSFLIPHLGKDFIHNQGTARPTGWPWTHYPWFLPLCQNDFLKNSWQSPASYGIISKVSYVEWYSSGWRGRFAKSLDRLYRCGSSNLPHSATGTNLIRDSFFYFYRKKEKEQPMAAPLAYSDFPGGSKSRLYKFSLSPCHKNLLI